jgi:hypothetical protein
MTWSQPDASDGEIVAAFNRHQRNDKGFGPALGPEAADAAPRVFADLGYVVEVADSPWKLGAEQAALQLEFLEGVAQAAAEAGARDADGWLTRRKALIGQSLCLIGHRDLLALPPSLASRTKIAC